MKLIYWGAVNAASDITTAAAVNTGGTQTRSAVVALIQNLAPGIIAQNPTIIATAAAAVATALQDASIVTGGVYNERAASMQWGVKTVAVPSTVPASVPALSTVSVQKSVALLTDGKLDPSVLPATDGGPNLADELALVADRGRPLYAPTGGSFDPTTSMFNFNPGQLMPWIVAREKVRRGQGNAVILSLGTSISRVIRDPLMGETFPKDSWPGQLLAGLGLPIGGTGIRHLSADVAEETHTGGFAEPTISISNPDTATNKIEKLDLGFAQSSFRRIIDSGTRTAWVEFNPEAGEYTELWLYGGEIAGTSVVTIDGVDKTWAGSTAVAGADIPALAGYASGQRISRVTLPNGTHTVRVHGTAAGVPFGGFEGRKSTGVILHRGAIAGRSQLAFFNTTGNLDGLPWAIDPWRAHLLVEELHINDWQNHYDVATFKAQKIALWSRARGRGAAVLAVIAPTPDLTMYPPNGGNNPPVTEYIRAIYEAALDSNVPVIDLAHRFVDYPNSAGMYAAVLDHIHLLALGAAYAALAIRNPVLA